MSTAYLPFSFIASSALVERYGADTRRIALLALRAAFVRTRQLEVAHQQISFRGDPIALSTHVTASGQLVVELDVGDPRLADRLILEEELRRAHGNRSTAPRQHRRPLPR